MFVHEPGFTDARAGTAGAIRPATNKKTNPTRARLPMSGNINGLTNISRFIHSVADTDGRCARKRSGPLSATDTGLTVALERLSPIPAAVVDMIGIASS